jgi:hypothetical protein
MELVVVTLLTLGVIVTLVTLAARHRSRIPEELATLPGPSASTAIVGTIFAALFTRQAGIDRITEHAERYGPIYRVWSGARWSVMVRDADVARQLYRSPHRFPKAQTPALRARFTSMFFGDNIAVCFAYCCSRVRAQLL